MGRTVDQLKERRLDRMRLGQAVAEILPLTSDPEIRVAMVPLTEAEYLQGIQKVAALPYDDSLAAGQVKDRHAQEEILVCSLKEPDDLSQVMFENTIEMREHLEVQDINYLWDHYLEMVDRSSPAIDSFTDEEIEAVKKVLVEMDWSVLSGKAWYALKRFLSTVGSELQPVSLPGFGSTSKSTTTKGSGESTSTVEQNSSEKPAKSAGSQ